MKAARLDREGLLEFEERVVRRPLAVKDDRLGVKGAKSTYEGGQQYGHGSRKWP